MADVDRCSSDVDIGLRSGPSTTGSSLLGDLFEDECVSKEGEGRSMKPVPGMSASVAASFKFLTNYFKTMDFREKEMKSATMSVDDKLAYKQRKLAEANAKIDTLNVKNAESVKQKLLQEKEEREIQLSEITKDLERLRAELVEVNAMNAELEKRCADMR
jgi:hypothetical protein